MGNNDLYLHIGRKSGKTITGEAIKREYERAIQEHEKRERLYVFLAAHEKPISDAGRFGKRSNHPLDAAPGAAEGGMSMGVYIKGMEMPFTCLTCDFHKCAGGVGDFCSLTKRRQFRFKNRPKDRPLVHVPPHGDLIDRDALRDNNCDAFEIDGADGTILAMDVSIIDDAPTIIPAEEGET